MRIIIRLNNLIEIFNKGQLNNKTLCYKLFSCIK